MLDSSALQIKFGESGAREYKYGGEELLDPARIVQIDRNPVSALTAPRRFAPTRRSPGGFSRPATSR